MEDSNEKTKESLWVERKQAEDNLAESEERYNRLVMEIDDGIVTTDCEGIITFANPAMIRIHGFEYLHQLVGRNFMEFIESPRDKVAKYLQQIINGGQSSVLLTAVLSQPTGMKVIVEVKAGVKKIDGKIVGTQGVLRDVTERRLLEKELRLALEQNEMLRRFLPKMCCSCKKIHVGEKWMRIEEIIEESTGEKVSHGICPECFIQAKLKYE